MVPSELVGSVVDHVFVVSVLVDGWPVLVSLLVVADGGVWLVVVPSELVGSVVDHVFVVSVLVDG